MKRHDADLLIKLVLVFFIALLSFSLGTFMGQQISKEDAERNEELKRQVQEPVIIQPEPEKPKIHFQLVPEGQ
jgi:hypothetical protein